MASVSKRRWTKPDGSTGTKWQVRYVDPATGKRPGRVFELKKDADAFMRKVEREIEDGMHTAAADSRTVAVVAHEFIAWQNERVKLGQLGRSRQVVCEGVCRNHIVPAIGPTLIAKLQWADIEGLHRAVAAKNLSPMSIKHIMGLMKQLEDFARKRGWTKARIVQDVNRDHGGVRAAVVEVPTPDQVRAILVAAATPKRLPGRKGSTVHRARCATPSSTAALAPSPTRAVEC